MQASFLKLYCIYICKPELPRRYPLVILTKLLKEMYIH